MACALVALTLSVLKLVVQAAGAPKWKNAAAHPRQSLFLPNLGGRRTATAERLISTGEAQTARTKKCAVSGVKQENSLAHTKWMCKYHIVFTPKN